tara:strand:+ start:16644 stop:17150 length:507 start_codon:yes stop_codon:yes gene_type:complete
MIALKNNGLFFSIFIIIISCAFSACNSGNNENNTDPNKSIDEQTVNHEIKDVVFIKKESKERVILAVEVPQMKDYAIGLSNKNKVENFGMLFNFREETKYQGFSMKNTKFNLSIAFIDANKIIIDIQEMKAFHDEIYISKYPFQYAIEAPEEWFLINEINVGDSVGIP